MLNKKNIHRKFKLNPINMNKNLRDFNFNNATLNEDIVNNVLKDNKFNEFQSETENMDYSVNMNLYHHSFATNSSANSLMNKKMLLKPHEREQNIKFYVKMKRLQNMSSQQKIIREVFSPPTKKNKHRHKLSFDNSSNYGDIDGLNKSPSYANKHYTNVIQRQSAINRDLSSRGMQNYIENGNARQRQINHHIFTYNLIDPTKSKRIVQVIPQQLVKHNELDYSNEKIFKLPSHRMSNRGELACNQ